MRAGRAAVIAELSPTPTLGRRAARAAHEQQRAPGAHLAGAVAGDADHQHRVLLERAARLRRSPSRPAARSRGRRPVTMTWSIGRLELARRSASRRSRVVGVERRGAQRAELGRRVLQPVGIAAGQDRRRRPRLARAGRSPAPMPALPPITTTVCPSSSGSRSVGGAAVRRSSSLLSSARHRRSRADRLARRRDLPAERLQRGDVDLRERRERLDRVGQDVERDVGADRERGLLQPLARLGAERVGAGQPLAVAEERQEAVALGVGARVGGGLRRPPTPGPWR